MLVVEDVCRALAAVHRAGFVHRDVKARNVIREQGGRVVLMDFGTSPLRPTSRRERAAREIAGTPVTMAPEVLAGPAPPRSPRCPRASACCSITWSRARIRTTDARWTTSAPRIATGGGRRWSTGGPDLPAAVRAGRWSARSRRIRSSAVGAGALLEALGAIDGSTRLRLARFS